MLSLPIIYKRQAVKIKITLRNAASAGQMMDNQRNTSQTAITDVMFTFTLLCLILLNQHQNHSITLVIRKRFHNDIQNALNNRLYLLYYFSCYWPGCTCQDSLYCTSCTKTRMNMRYMKSIGNCTHNGIKTDCKTLN